MVLKTVESVCSTLGLKLGQTWESYLTVVQVALDQSIGTLSKPRRQRQRERHKTKGLMSRTIAVHVHYNS